MKIINILNTIREDFVMLQNGKWDITNDKSSINDSLDLIDKAIELIKNNSS